MTTSMDRPTVPDVVRWNPWPQMFDWNPRLTGLLDTMRHTIDREHAPGGQLEETDSEFVLELDLPGVAKKDITIDVTGRRVSVHGNRTEKKHEGIMRQSTRVTGTFAYEVQLPTAVEESAVAAHLDGGVLTIEMPKAKSAKTSRISIT